MTPEQENTQLKNAIIALIDGKASVCKGVGCYHAYHHGNCIGNYPNPITAAIAAANTEELAPPQ